MSDDFPLHEFEQPREFSRPDSRDTFFEIARIDGLSEAETPTVPHRHTYYEIFWIMGGSGTHYIDFENYPFQPNTLFFITPGQIHFPIIKESLSGYVLLFTDDFLSLNRLDHNFLRGFDFFHRVDHPPAMHLSTEQSVHFDNFCRDLLAEYQSENFGKLVVLQSLLQQFLIQAQRFYHVKVTPAKLSAGDALVQQFIRLIDIHYLEKQSVQEYASLLAVTAGHLSDTTRKVLGVPPSQLIHQRLVVEAKRLLLHSDQSVVEIGQRVGFADPSYFTRFFKRETKQSPSTFRTSFRKKYQISRNS